MELKDIIAISGKSGLFKVVARARNHMIVESLDDKKRFPAYAHQQISSLGEISVFTEDEDVALKEVLKKISDKQGGAEALNHKSADAELKAWFAEVMPAYDKERVYVSDIRKITLWYNALCRTGSLTAVLAAGDAEEKEGEPAKTEDTEAPDTANAAAAVKEEAGDDSLKETA